MISRLSTATDTVFNAKGDGPLADRRLIYLFAVARFVVFAHNTRLRNPRERRSPNPPVEADAKRRRGSSA